MAYVNVAEWKPDQVTEWLKGLDSSIAPYLHLFSNYDVNGHQLLNVRPEDLDHLGIKRLGHQELILEAVEQLRNFHYELDRENLQLLALRLSCQAHSLHNELRTLKDSKPVSTQTLADVASVVKAVKPLVCWLDRPPFSGQLEYADRKNELLTHSLEIATCAQRDRFAERPVEEIRASCQKLASLADGIIQDIADPLILQPASLDLATLRKRGGDDLGFYIVPSFYGVHQIGEIKFGSPAHQCRKVEEGDEIVQVNYQTVVGWQQKKVFALFEESVTDVFLTLKKRPRHTKVYGQIYMKPYRLPSKKRAPAYTRWHENLPSPRPELLTIPDFEMPLPRSAPKTPPLSHTVIEPLISTRLSTSSESDIGSGCDEVSLDYELEGHASPTSMRLYLPKPRVPVQRRATITGASPTSHRPPVDLEEFWRELKLEKKWKGSNYSAVSQERDDARILRNKSPCEHSERPSTCLGFENGQRNISLEGIDHKAKYQVRYNFNPGDARLHTTLQSADQSGMKRCHFSDDVKSYHQEPEKELKPDEKKGKQYITKFELNIEPSESKHGVSELEKGNPPSCQNIEPLLNCSLKSTKECSEEEKMRKISCESQVGELPVLQHRERGRLDKSYSTPAYDLSELEGLEVSAAQSSKRDPPMIKVENQTNESKTRKGLNPPDLTSALESVEHSPKQERVHDFSTHAVFKFPPVSSTSPSPCSFINQQSNSDQVESPGIVDANSNPVVHGRVVETINSHLLLANFGKEDDEENCGSICDINNVYRNSSTLRNDVTISSPDIISDLKIRKLSTNTEEDLQNGNEDLTQELNKLDLNFDSNQNSPVGNVPSRKETNVDRTVKTTQTRMNTSLLDQRNKENDSDASLPPARTSSGGFKRQAPVPPLRHSPSHDKKDQSLSLTPIQPAIHSKLAANPPEPPPRPSPNPPTRSPLTPTEQSKANSLRAIISGKAGVSKPSYGSPKVSQKKNPLLAKRRQVGVKDLGVGDYQGWLYRRLRIGGSGAQWIKGWFLLKGTTLYGFKNREAHKADCFISLPGFTISQAEEVKSRRFAFKVYHTGTVFYFAAESEEELGAWLDCLSVATLALDLNAVNTSFSEGAMFSETEDEGEEQEVAESCFPSPKMRKFTNFLSAHMTTTAVAGSTAPSPKPARSHQNLASVGESKTYDIQKKFGSLKKFGYRSRNSNLLLHQPSSSASSLSGSETSQDVSSLSAPHSLDRKYLRFLSSSKHQCVPVPTAQFRSYRRVAANEGIPIIPAGKVSDASTSNNKGDSVHTDDSASPTHRLVGLGEGDQRRGGRVPGPRTDEMAGMLTLEQFMLLRQEEERLQNQPTHGTQPQDRGRDRGRERAIVCSNYSSTPQHEPSEGYTEDPVCSLQRTPERRRTPPPPPPVPVRPIPAVRSALPAPPATSTSERPLVAPRTRKTPISPQSREVFSGNKQGSLAPDTPHRTPLAPKQSLLKNAALYQPPPVAFPPSPTALGPSFEMHLDQQSATSQLLADEGHSPRGKGTGSKFRQLFSPKHGQPQPLPHTPYGPPTSSYRPEAYASPEQTYHKTLLGSPRLHRALFGHVERTPKSVGSSDFINSNLSSTSTILPGIAPQTSSPISQDWSPDYSSSPKPTMGVSMLGKKPLPLPLPALSLAAMSPPLSPPQTPISPPPDYPGLEYPPVFEPGTYSLSDTSSLLCQTPLQMSSGLNSPCSDASDPLSSPHCTSRDK